MVNPDLFVPSHLVNLSVVVKKKKKKEKRKEKKKKKRHVPKPCTFQYI